MIDGMANGHPINCFVESRPGAGKGCLDEGLCYPMMMETHNREAILKAFATKILGVRNYKAEKTEFYVGNNFIHRTGTRTDKRGSDFEAGLAAT